VEKSERILKQNVGGKFWTRVRRINTRASERNER